MSENITSDSLIRTCVHFDITVSVNIIMHAPLLASPMAVEVWGCKHVGMENEANLHLKRHTPKQSCLELVHTAWKLSLVLAHIVFWPKHGTDVSVRPGVFKVWESEPPPRENNSFLFILYSFYINCKTVQFTAHTAEVSKETHLFLKMYDSVPPLKSCSAPQRRQASHFENHWLRQRGTVKKWNFNSCTSRKKLIETIVETSFFFLEHLTSDVNIYFCKSCLDVLKFHWTHMPRTLKILENNNCS